MTKHQLFLNILARDKFYVFHSCNNYSVVCVTWVRLSLVARKFHG